MAYLIEQAGRLRHDRYPSLLEVYILQFKHPTKPGTVTVSGQPGIDIPPGTLNNILKQAGLK
ncbi:MAG: type II toxin-antitoxin system HicA family toxin [Woeseia sp.]